MNTNPKFIIVTDNDDNEKMILNTDCIEYAYKKDDYNEKEKDKVTTVIIQKDGTIWEVKETVEELYNILTNNVTKNTNTNKNNVIKPSLLPHEPIEYQLEK